MKLINLAKKYNFICFWCKHKFPLDELSRDHIYPVHRPRSGAGKGGGEGCKGECVLACIFCNQKRGNKSFEQFSFELAEEKRKYQEELNRLWGD